MASYKRRREDEDTFGFGRYPKRSRRDCTDHERAYHSMSVTRLHHNRKGSKLNGLNSCDQNFYHFSLSSELYARNSNSHGQRYSTCSNSHGGNHYSKRLRGYKVHGEGEGLIKTKVPREESPKKKSHTYSRVWL